MHSASQWTHDCIESHDASLWRSLGRTREWDIGVGVDRLDYTKGIPEKFRAIDLFLDQNPEYKKRFVYIQLGAPSREHIPFLSMLAFYKMSHLCIVGSLHDGMNLVAKEYIAAKTDSDGVLILSRFTGASRELNEALLVDPYAADEFAQTIKGAIEMPPEEGSRRMRKLREIVRERNIFRWADQILTKAIRIS